MKVSLRKALFSEGLYSGTPSLFVQKDGKAEEKNENEVLDAIVATGVRSVAIVGILAEDGELLDLVRSLAKSGKFLITVVSDCSDMGIESIRHLASIRFFLRLNVPTAENNQMNPKVLPLLKERDELKVTVSSLEEYLKASEFLKSKQISNPTVLFNIDKVPDEEKEEFFKEIWKDDKPFHFNYRITKALNV